MILSTRSGNQCDVAWREPARCKLILKGGKAIVAVQPGINKDPSGCRLNEIDKGVTEAPLAVLRRVHWDPKLKDAFRYLHPAMVTPLLRLSRS